MLLPILRAIRFNVFVRTHSCAVYAPISVACNSHRAVDNRALYANQLKTNLRYFYCDKRNFAYKALFFKSARISLKDAFKILFGCKFMIWIQNEHFEQRRQFHHFEWFINYEQI